MEFNAKYIAELLNGRIEGNPDSTVNKVSKIEEAEAGSLTFLANPRYTHFIYSTNASIILVNNDLELEKEITPTLIRVDNAYTALAKILEAYQKLKGEKNGISQHAIVSSKAKLGKDVYIGENAVISEGAEIGDRAKIFPNSYIGENAIIGSGTCIHAGVMIYSDNVIGNNCNIHGGVVIGSDGFGFAPQSDSNYKKIAQIGNVIIEDNVEIGANTTIDRATMGSTIIRKGVKLDNLIQIAHNVEIGENTVIAAQTGISGSAKIGNNCMIGGQVGITGHLTIADEVKIGAQSGISSSITTKGAIVLGSPAFEIGKYRKSYVHFRNLEKLVSRIEKIENKINK